MPDVQSDVLVAPPSCSNERLRDHRDWLTMCLVHVLMGTPFYLLLSTARQPGGGAGIQQTGAVWQDGREGTAQKKEKRKMYKYKLWESEAEG